MKVVELLENISGRILGFGSPPRPCTHVKKQLATRFRRADDLHGLLHCSKFDSGLDHPSDPFLTNHPCRF